jgi:hypothetical protein
MTNYEEFKAIADDIAEMYANGYADYAEYFSETFSGIGEISAVSRLSDRVYALRGADTKSVEFTKGMKAIAIDAMLAIGETNIILAKAEGPFLEEGARYWCMKPWIEEIFGQEYTHLVKGRIYKYRGGLIFEDEVSGTQILTHQLFLADQYLQKIIEKK